MANQEREQQEFLTLPASQEVKLKEVKLLESGEFTEEQLEQALIIVPELISPAPFFCGRQLPTLSGPLDLFGFGGMEHPSVKSRISDQKFPTIYELKSSRIGRRALIQVFDYSMRLEYMTAADLAWHIVSNSGRAGSGSGIGRIWKPEVIREVIEEAWAYGKIVWKVVIGTSYDSHIESMASRLDIKLYTVSELCEGYRERISNSE